MISDPPYINNVFYIRNYSNRHLNVVPFIVDVPNVKIPQEPFMKTCIKCGKKFNNRGKICSHCFEELGDE